MLPTGHANPFIPFILFMQSHFSFHSNGVGVLGFWGARGGLVHEDDARLLLAGQLLGDGEPLLLATGALGHERVPTALQVELLDEVVHEDGRTRALGLLCRRSFYVVPAATGLLFSVATAGGARGGDGGGSGSDGRVG